MAIVEHQEAPTSTLLRALAAARACVPLDEVLFSAASNRGAAANPAPKPMARAKKSLLLFMKNSFDLANMSLHRTFHPH